MKNNYLKNYKYTLHYRMTDNNKQTDQPKFNAFTNFTTNTPVNNQFSTVNSTFTNSFTTKPVSNNTVFNSTLITSKPIIHPTPEPSRPLTRQETLEKEITDAVRDLIFIIEKCKIKTDDVNNENERNKMMKIIEVYYESCNNQIVQLALTEIYKGLKKESYSHNIKFEEMDFDVPDFTYVCFREYVKKQFDKMQFHINKYY